MNLLRPITLALALASALVGGSLQVRAQPTTSPASPSAVPADPRTRGNEPTGCYPPCRSGFTCQAGTCISLCNPPCPSGERCVAGECGRTPQVSRRRPRNPLYLAMFGGYRAGLNDIAEGTGDLRAEFGGRHVAFQIGPSFASRVTTVRGAVVGNVPLRLVPTLPLFAIPMVQLGYAFNWLDDGNETRQQDFFITPGARLRYNITRRFAVMLDLIQIEIAFLRLQSDKEEDYKRVKDVPVYWGTHVGLAVMY